MDYDTVYSEVRDCRRSSDHELAYIRVFASPEAADVYEMRDREFPFGATLVKEEHANPSCSDLVGWTAMRKEEAGYAASDSDWHWQRVRSNRSVTEDGRVARCAACHADCGVPPDGHDFTCTMP